MNNTVPSRYNWMFGTNKEEFSLDNIIPLYINKMLIRTQQMFEYKGLPDTIPKKDLEFILQWFGTATIAKVNDNLYAFNGSLIDKPDVYYHPTQSLVTNIALDISKTYDIDKDCVIVLNDSMYSGLRGIIEHNAYLLAQCDISFKFSTINIRVPAIIDAPNDTAKASAEDFLKKVEKGESLGVIGDDEFFEGLKVYDYAKAEYGVQHLIELKQYILGTFYQELGIRSSFNMKREAINESEASMSEDILYPLCDEMLEQRKLGVERINKMFGTNISVDFSSVWKHLRESKDLADKLLESEINENDNDNEDGNKEKDGDNQNEQDND